MSNSERERILAAVEKALGNPPRDESIFSIPQAASHPSWVGPEEPWGNLETELKNLLARFHMAKDLEGARAVVRSIIEEHSVRTAVRWEHPLLEALGLDELLQEAGVELLRPEDRKESFVQTSAGADLGITAAEAIVAQSGTVIVRARAGQERSTSLLPPVHLAVLTTEQRLRSMGDLIPVFRGWMSKDGKLPSAVHMIAGPSRTADIALTMTLGAHGPKVLHVLVVEAGAVRAVD